MYLNSLQTSAINILDKYIDDQPPTKKTLLGASIDSATQGDLGRIQLYQNRHPVQTVYLGNAGSFSDISGAVIASLPKVITPEFKKHLKTLDNFAKGDKNTTDEHAIAAYKALGKTLKVAVTRTLIDYGIRIGLAKTPYVGPFAGVIANIAAGPLAEMAVALSDKHHSLLQKLINIALKYVGKEPISAESQDLFMAKALGKFAGSILSEIEKREKSVPLRAEKSVPLRAEKVTPVGTEFLTRT